MRKAGFLFIIFLSIFILTNNTFALPVIDFADSSFSVVDGQSTKTVNNGGLDITFSSSKGLLTHNPGLSGGVDGIGIGDDEISLGEQLEIGFSADLYLSKIYITDLFNEGDPQYKERGQFKYQTGSSWTDWMTFEAPSTNDSFPVTNGEYIVPLDPSSAIRGLLFAGIDSSRNDYSVRGVDTAATPEPATMLLLGSGLVGIAAFGRKKFFKK